MKQEHTLFLGDDELTVTALTDDVRLSLDVNDDDSEEPTTHAYSLSAHSAVQFARGLMRTVRRLRANQLSFGEAIDVMKADGRVTRPSWNGKGMWVALQVPDAQSKMKRPYLYMHHADQVLGPWSPTQSDVLADDWEVVNG